MNFEDDQQQQDDAQELDERLRRIENQGAHAKTMHEEEVLNDLLRAEGLLDSSSDDDDETSNKVHADGTRDRNLILWEAATWKQKLYAVFESGSFPSDISITAERISFGVAIVMVLIILLSCLTVIVESYPQYVTQPTPIWVDVSEVVSVVIFTYDLILRFITCPDKEEFVTDLLNWIDLVAVLPFYIEQAAAVRAVAELRILRVLRLARIVRVFRLLNINKIPGMAAVLASIQHSYPGIFLFLSIGVVFLLMTSTAMFYAERGHRTPDGTWIRCGKYLPEANCSRSIAEGGVGSAGGDVSPFQSIIDAFWWSFNTMSTVGLGDVYPVTKEGELVACLTMVCAVFILALPPMILTGNYEIYKGMKSEILRVSWVKLAEQQKKLRRSDLESPRTQIIRKMGWNDDEPADFDKLPEEKKSASTSNKVDVDKMMAGTMSLREAAKARSRLRRKRRAERLGRPIGSVQFGGQTVEVYRRQGRPNIHRYFYEPIFRLALCEDGVPVITIIRGRCGMPCVARLQIELDHPNLRKAVIDLVEAVDPVGHVQCDLGGGFEIKHFSSSRAATDNGVPAWEMRPVDVVPHFRNSDCPLYFTWTQDENILDSLNDDEVAEMALSHLVGSSLHIRAFLPTPAMIRRIPVEQQIIHHTRFQRELSVIARPASEDDPETFAFVTKPTLQHMLSGVSQKIMIEPTTKFEDPQRVDLEVADRLMSRLREMKLSQVPANCRHEGAVYDYDLLSLDDIVVEVPISLFDADANDEVDEDALGYIDARMTSVQARCLRVDIKTEFDVVDP